MSTLMVCLRAVVMLGCLVALPLLALLCGPLPSSAPPVLQQVFEYGTRLFGDQRAVPAPRLMVAPPFVSEVEPELQLSAVPPGASVSELQPTQSPLPTVEPPAAHEQATESDPTKLAARLQQLGATHYALERWGSGDDLFRFTCHMAIAHNPEHTRHFEAIGGEPETAIQDVVARVELWRDQQQRRLAGR